MQGEGHFIVSMLSLDDHECKSHIKDSVMRFPYKLRVCFRARWHFYK